MNGRLQIDSIGILAGLRAQSRQQFGLLQSFVGAIRLLHEGGPGHEFGERKSLSGLRGNIDVQPGHVEHALALVAVLPNDGAEGAIEFHLRVDLSRGQQRLRGGDDPGHRLEQILLQVAAALQIALNVALEPEVFRQQPCADGFAASLFPTRLFHEAPQLGRGEQAFGGAPAMHRPKLPVADRRRQSLQIEKQTLVAIFPEQLVVDGDEIILAVALQQDVVPGEGIFILIPAQYGFDLAATGGRMAVLALSASVDAKHAALRLVADVAGVDDHHVPTVLGVGRVAVGRDDSADLTVVEREDPEMLGDQNDRIALIFIRAKRPGRHDLAGLEAERFAQVVQPGNEGAIAQHHAGDVKIRHQGADVCGRGVHERLRRVV